MSLPAESIEHERRDTAVPLAMLSSDPPGWLTACAFQRNAGYMRKHSDTPPRRGLLWEWALDYSGLPAAHRRLLDVLTRLSSGEWRVKLIAERVGADPGTVRRQIQELVGWDWLQVNRPTPGRPYRYVITIPVDKPPNRVARPGRKRQ